MFFNINKKLFSDGLNIVSKAVSLNSPLPVYHNIKLSVKDDYIQLTASDGDIFIFDAIVFAKKTSSITNDLLLSIILIAFVTKFNSILFVLDINSIIKSFFILSPIIIMN